MNTEYLTEKDAGGWMELARRVSTLFPGPDDENALADHRRQLSGFISRKEAFVVKDKDVLRGGVLFSRRDNEICFLAVDGRYRRLGLGTKLISAALERLDTGRGITLYAYTRQDKNGAAARAFYQNWGLYPVKQQPFSAGRYSSLC